MWCQHEQKGPYIFRTGRYFLRIHLGGIWIVCRRCSTAASSGSRYTRCVIHIHVGNPGVYTGCPLTTTYEVVCYAPTFPHDAGERAASAASSSVSTNRSTSLGDPVSGTHELYCSTNEKEWRAIPQRTVRSNLEVSLCINYLDKTDIDVVPRRGAADRAGQVTANAQYPTPCAYSTTSTVNRARL